MINSILASLTNDFPEFNTSLGENVKVKEGDLVNRGDQLGVVSSSASAELDAGAHLHFSLEDNGRSVDPAAYLNIGTK